MKNSIFRSVVVSLFVLSLGLLGMPVFAQSPIYMGMSVDGTMIPDVNKVNPADPNDGSCWLASAANLLGAAGYGVGGDAQSCADNIYMQLTNAWGTYNGGAPDQAISYWLAMYGQNPDAPEYLPMNDFTDVTAVYNTVVQSDYTFLQGELERGLYVGVQFANPGHAVTFVGWDDTTTPTQSSWTDSDIFVGSAAGSAPFENHFATTSPYQWNLAPIGTPVAYLQQANGYATFGLGLDKSEDAKMEYDVAWFPSPSGPTFREAGFKSPIYDDPTGVLGWQPAWLEPQGGTTYYPFRIDDEENHQNNKTISLLVDYYGRDANFANEDIRLRYIDEAAMEVVAVPTSVQLSPDNGQVLFTWDLDYQPAWEEILFPTQFDYQILEGTVASWDVATIGIFDGIAGDANGDGMVDGSDVTILANNWQRGVPGGDPSVTWAMGDFNGDLMIDGSDVTILANNWQAGVTASAAAVPEPSTFLMLFSIFGLWLALKKRTKKR